MIKVSGYLEWDSKFFKKQIAFIDGFKATDKQISEEIDRFLQCGTDCIYLYTRRAVDLPRYDIVLADKKRIYVLDNPEYKELSYNPYIVQPIYVGKPSDLYDLAIQSGEHSRFKIDPHFSDDEFTNLYKKWIDNSVDEGFADFVLVALDSEPQGFITAKIKGDRISIGLFATNKNHRGKGIGTQLIQKIINVAAKRGLKVEVVTQANNKSACEFYERRGFKKSDEQYVYHVWDQNRNK